MRAKTLVYIKTLVYMMGGLALFALAPAADTLAAQQQTSQDSPTRYSVVNLGTLGGTSSSGNTINNAGWVMGNANLPGDAATHAALWVAGLEVDLGTLGGANSGVEWPVRNDRGVIAGISSTASIDPLKENWSCSAFFPGPPDKHVCVGFVWRDGAMTALATLGGTNGYASGVNKRGQIVGWAENTVHDPTCNPPQVLQFEAVLYSPDGRIRELPPLPGDVDGAATAINDVGQIVGISGTCDNAVGAYTARHAVLWHNGTATDIGNFGGAGWNTPTDINNQGQVVGFADLPGDVVGGHLKFNPVAFVWSEGKGIQEIPPLPGDTNSVAYAINERGQVVGQSFGGPEGSRAFIWQNGTATDLNTLLSPGSSLYLVYAEGINDRGEITGGACVATAGVCTGTSETPAFLAVPKDDAADGNANAAISLATEAVVNATPEVAVAPQLVQRPLRRWGLDRR